MRRAILQGFTLILTLIFIFSSDLPAASRETKPLTKDNIPVPPEKMPGYILEQLKKDPFVKEHFGWKLAFCQHPMYLLIDEDRGEPAVGERIPPWGAPDKEGYVARVRRNLNSLEELSRLKLNYQWSAVELQSMCDSFPDVYVQMKQLYENGSLDFLDGTYSQAHLQVLGSESNWRQFEYGLEVYRDLFDKKVDVYARQETGLHLQLPQLLKKFEYGFATLPAFIAMIEIVDGKFEFIERLGSFEPIAGDDFIDSVGLDESTIPFYVMPHFRDYDEIQQDLYSTPKIYYEFPDMDEVDRDKYERYLRLYDWVLLKDALIGRYEAAPSRAKAKIYSYWSYIEGVWAEELMRQMKSAEDFALLAEQMYCMAKLAGCQVDKSLDIKEIWKEILKSQHHDISWIEVTDLRRKSINRLGQTIAQSNEIMEEIAEKLVAEDAGSVAVFNGLPYKRRCLVKLEGRQTFFEIDKFQEFKGQSLGFVDVPAGGFSSFVPKPAASVSAEKKMPESLKRKFYKIEFSEEGLMKQITANNGTELLNCGEYLGGEIRARIDKKWVNNRKAKCNYYEGPVCDILERSIKLGNIPLQERYYFFKDEPFIKAELEFEFDGNEVGYMWIDKTKINVYFPTKGSRVYHDIPFGYIESSQKRPLFAINWVSCGGLVYVNRGTVKHWVEDGVIANVLGWGGNHFSNRLHWDWLESPQYDIRLYGRQKIEYYLLPMGE
ncbi:hypothetical protein ACFL1G_11600, partial [Planctomycetota bacterium]